MKQSVWRTVPFVVVVPLLMSMAAGARSRRDPRGLRVTWLRPERVTPVRRAALTRLLSSVVRGEPLRGANVQDSHPQIDASAVSRWTALAR